MSRPSRQQSFAGFEDDAISQAHGEADANPLRSLDVHIDGSQQKGALAGKTVYVIDAHSLIFQVYHAMPEMTGPAGQPVNAIFGFLRDVLQLIRNHQPDYLFCAFDLPGTTFRHDMFPSYKEDRVEMPDDLVPQIYEIRRLLDALKIPVVALENYEADDVLATMARMVEQQRGQCVLVTNDKDCRQLITENVRLLNVRKNEFMDAAALESEWGIRPDQVVDFQALVGDAVDNVPGVPLIGPKIAAQLIQQFGSLESIYKHADEIAGQKRRENLKVSKDQVLISRALVRLVDDLPLQVDWSGGSVGLTDAGPALEFCREYGFRSLGDQVATWAGHADRVRELSSPNMYAHYRAITDEQDLAALAKKLRSAGRFALDTETTGLNSRNTQLVGISVAWEPGHAAYVPVRAPHGEPTLPIEIVVRHLGNILDDPNVAKLGQNIKFDLVVLRAEGIRVRGIEFDSMIASFVLDSGARSHGLDYLAEKFLDHHTIKISQLIGTGRSQKRMDEVPLAEITPYACEDADVALQLAFAMMPLLERDQFQPLFYEIEMPLVEVLADMEFQGITVNRDVLGRLSSEFAERIAAYEAEIFAMAGHAFNLASPKQLATVLFDELKLPVVKKTKTGFSTDVEVLEQLAELHALPRTVIAQRHLAKLKSTYLDALPTMIHPQSGRIHTSYNQVVAVTGRLSSADPNLQNLPVRSAEGREIRQAFEPRAGWQLLTADYSQVELRVLAHFSRDESLTQAFARDEDIHARVAAEVFHIPLEQVTAEQRRRAKAVNFGVVYGQSAFGLAKGLNITQEEAAEFIEAYFARYPGIETFMEQVLDACYRDRFVTTMFGRRRRIEGVRPADKRTARQRNLPERTAINSVIQGTAADLIKLAMIRIHRRLERESRQAKMLLQIHDELVLEVPPDELSEVRQLVVFEMEHVTELAVRLKVDTEVGSSFG